MKTVFLVLLFSIISLSAYSHAEDFLGAPVVPEAKVVLKSDSRLELVSPLPHDKILEFYKEALKNSEDIRYRDWKDATYIEDDGRRPWHSITISKQGKEGTTIVIVKDNWTWILGTLVLRFIGVFVVLLLLFVGMSASGAIISRSVKKMGGEKNNP